MCTCVCVYYSACMNLHSLNLIGEWGWADKLRLVFLCSSPYGEEHPGLVRFGFVFQCKMFLEVFSTSAAHQQWFSFPVLGSDPWHPCEVWHRGTGHPIPVRQRLLFGFNSFRIVTQLFADGLAYCSRVFEAAVLIQSRSDWSLPNSEVQISQGLVRNWGESAGNFCGVRLIQSTVRPSPVGTKSGK